MYDAISGGFVRYFTHSLIVSVFTTFGNTIESTGLLMLNGEWALASLNILLALLVGKNMLLVHIE